jgi:hypothetical protein
MSFIEEIFQIEYDQTPDYIRLQFLLMKCMISIGEDMTNDYDWSQISDNRSLGSVQPPV